MVPDFVFLIGVAIYFVIGFATYIFAIKQMKKTEWITGEDLVDMFFAFVICWPVTVFGIFNDHVDIGGALVRWVNK